MTADEIRKMPLVTAIVDAHPQAGSPGEVVMVEMSYIQATFMREIAAQLAEMNAKLALIYKYGLNSSEGDK